MRLVLVDDDPVFRATMLGCASARGIFMDAYDNLLEIDTGAGHAAYDAAIVDFDLGPVNGLESASWLEGVFGDAPVLLVSAVLGQSAPPFCRAQAFLPKSRGCDSIVDKAMALARRRRYARDHDGVVKSSNL